MRIGFISTRLAGAEVFFCQTLQELLRSVFNPH